jgi:4-amino-4-deoxychorismate lyase
MGGSRPMRSPLLLETIKVEAGEAQHLDYHNQRFNSSRKSLYEINRVLDLGNYIIPPSNQRYRCRILYDQEIRKVEYFPYRPKIIQKIALIESTVQYSFKYADRRIFERLLAASPQSDEVLIVQNGYLTDTTIANIAFLEKGRWITPDKPLLHGTTRKRLINEGLLTPKAIRKDEIHRFDSFALMNAMIGFKIISPIAWEYKI